MPESRVLLRQTLRAQIKCGVCGHVGDRTFIRWNNEWRDVLGGRVVDGEADYSHGVKPEHCVCRCGRQHPYYMVQVGGEPFPEPEWYRTWVEETGGSDG